MSFLLYANDIIMTVYLAAIFVIIIDLKFSIKKTISIMLCFLVIALPLYFYLISLSLNRGLISLLVFSIPSFIICYFLSKYKGFRFVFTFCTVDLIGFVVIAIARTLGMLFDDSPLVIFIALNIQYITLIFASLNIREGYIKIQRTLTSGWVSFGIVTIFFYMMMYLLSSYPVAMIERIEYLPVFYAFIVTVISVYIVIYFAVIKSVKIYDEEKNRELSKAKLDLEDSKLQLKELYVKLAYTDALTGLKNRTAFEEKKIELSSELNHEINISCLMIDLNNLKHTNDNYGHDKGDEILKNFSVLLQEVFESTQTIYRIGGDEFIILFKDMFCEDIKEQIDLLRRKVTDRNKTSIYKISFAAGVSDTCQCKTKDIDELILNADRRMYENKKSLKAILD